MKITIKSDQPINEQSIGDLKKAMFEVFGNSELLMQKSYIPGQDHPVKMIGVMEKEYFDLINWQKFYKNLAKFLGLTSLKKSQNEWYKPDGDPFSIEQMNIVNNFILKELFIDPLKIEGIAVRNFIMGHIIEGMIKEQVEIETKAILLSKLPWELKIAAKEYNLTLPEIRAVRVAILRTANHITKISETARSEVANLIIQSHAERWDRSRLSQELFRKITDSEENLNRDWRRVAIYEANNNTQQGFIAGVKPGKYVVGVSMPDACDWCLKNIHGKHYRVRANAPQDYEHLEPGTEEYNEIADIWDSEVWLGKSNIGRSSAKRKRIAPGEFIKREHHELWTPTLTAHAHCRCYWREEY